MTTTHLISEFWVCGVYLCVCTFWAGRERQDVDLALESCGGGVTAGCKFMVGEGRGKV